MTLDYMSYSRYKAYTSCPRSYYLGYEVGAEEKRTWYLPIGSVVHEAIEWHLRGDELDMESRFYGLISAQMYIEPDLSKWLAGGPKDNPITEERALRRAQECYEKALTYLSDVDVWEVEYDASGSLPGLDVPMKAFVDIIGEHKTEGPIIGDWKTGSTKPDNFQLETYVALINRPGKFWNITNGEPMKFKGKYWMISPTYTSETRFVDLTKVDPAAIGSRYQAVVDDIRKRKWMSKAGFGCKYCFHQDNCTVNAGPTARATFYDKAHEDGYPF